ncbi:hypothetical protein B0H11DRAFT_2245711 [Mycena galericulata]|nr:hypothetical protein B0H11DRAFT_2245711 [Mycena galericulata]
MSLISRNSAFSPFPASGFSNPSCGRLRIPKSLERGGQLPTPRDANITYTGPALFQGGLHGVARASRSSLHRHTGPEVEVHMILTSTAFPLCERLGVSVDSHPVVSLSPSSSRGRSQASCRVASPSPSTDRRCFVFLFAGTFVRLGSPPSSLTPSRPTVYSITIRHSPPRCLPIWITRTSSASARSPAIRRPFASPPAHASPFGHRRVQYPHRTRIRTRVSRRAARRPLRLRHILPRSDDTRICTRTTRCVVSRPLLVFARVCSSARRGELEWGFRRPVWWGRDHTRPQLVTGRFLPLFVVTLDPRGLLGFVLVPLDTRADTAKDARARLRSRLRRRYRLPRPPPSRTLDEVFVVLGRGPFVTSRRSGVVYA